MDKKNKIVIIVLVVLAILFFSGAAGNLMHKKRDGTNENNYKQGGWETTLGEWMSPFAPSLDVDKLLGYGRNKFTCKSSTFQNKYKVILLNKSKDTCVINIPELNDEKYSKGKLRLVNDGAVVPAVTVLYMPDGESKKPDPMPRFKNKDEKISFVVLKKGGELTVACKGCFDSQAGTIRVIFE